jgi:hypothetical protein
MQCSCTKNVRTYKFYVYFADLVLHINDAHYVCKHSDSQLPDICHDSTWEYRIMKSLFLICSCVVGIKCAGSQTYACSSRISSSVIGNLAIASRRFKMRTVECTAHIMCDLNAFWAVCWNRFQACFFEWMFSLFRATYCMTSERKTNTQIRVLS